MLSIVEKFLFENFRNMPAWVRVTSYLVMLFLFVYLALVPRFVDGQLVIKDPGSGGHLPYRGAQLQMQVEGRNYKFSANEEGFWSVPIVSRLPVGLEIQVFHEDLGQWFPVAFSGTQLWRLNAHRVEVSESRPFVRIAAPAPWIGALVPEARAGLVLPSGVEQTLDLAARRDVRRSVFGAISAATGTELKLVGAKFALSGSGAPSYVQRVKIIGAIEKQYRISIPDEHWRPMATAQELVEYVEQRVLLNRRYPALKDGSPSWPALQQSLPPQGRPVYRR